MNRKDTGPPCLGRSVCQNAKLFESSEEQCTVRNESRHGIGFILAINIEGVSVCKIAQICGAHGIGCMCVTQRDYDLFVICSLDYTS